MSGEEAAKERKSSGAAAAEATTCADDHPGCPGWASSGECAKNPSYMTTACRLSCGRCALPAPTPDVHALGQLMPLVGRTLLIGLLALLWVWRQRRHQQLRSKKSTRSSQLTASSELEASQQQAHRIREQRVRHWESTMPPQTHEPTPQPTLGQGLRRKYRADDATVAAPVATPVATTVATPVAATVAAAVAESWQTRAMEGAPSEDVSRDDASTRVAAAHASLPRAPLFQTSSASTLLRLSSAPAPPLLVVVLEGADPASLWMATRVWPHTSIQRRLRAPDVIALRLVANRGEACFWHEAILSLATCVLSCLCSTCHTRMFSPHTSRPTFVILHLATRSWRSAGAQRSSSHGVRAAST